LGINLVVAKPFDIVENQIGFCGIWCGSCPAGNGSVIELTRRYEETVKRNQLEKWAPKDFDFKEFMKGLASLQRVSLCNGCLKGDGNPNCVIRICAKEKNVSSCSECELLVSCKKFEMLEKSHPNIRSDLAKTKNVAKKDLVSQWKTELRHKFPHCLVLCSSS
jgi:hypothetical protein